MRRSVILTSALALGMLLPVQAKDLRVRLPKKSKTTPVQNFNRAGVNALEKHDYTHAKKLFYKAYLLDPYDPFTLNNLGYVDELEVVVDRAQRSYGLSAAMNSEAEVDKSTSESALHKPVTQVAGHFEEGNLEANKLNLEAISFLIKGRPFEAEKILNSALQSDPKNPFTLNNMGYDMELQGELQKAIQYYQQAADQHSNEKVIVAVKKDWRGRPISEIAGGNATRVEKGLAKANTPEAQVALLNLRGVSALNRNDLKSARGYFEQAYAKDNNNAFALNNMGYLAELDGDKETAQLYYERAKSGAQADRRITVASDPHIEGKRLEAVATSSDQGIAQRLAAAQEARRRSTNAPVTLYSRGFSQTPPPPAEIPKEATPQPPTTVPESAAPGTANSQGNATQPVSAATPGTPAPTQPAPATPSAPAVQERDPVPAPK